MKNRIALLAALSALAAAAPASAALTAAFDGKVPCTTASDGLITCSGIATTFDGTAIDVNLVLPSAAGNLPLLGFYHGWGGAKSSTSSLTTWAKKGYAAFSMSDRGWGGSCGGGPSFAQTVALTMTHTASGTASCTNGYNHLLDTRYEVRDAQTLIGQLADEGLVDPQRVGATGGSYGGGMSMSLAALKNRVMLPDGRLIPWTSPKLHLPMQIAVAAPEIPWTDLAYALDPNGRNLDYLVDNKYGDRLGVPKLTFVAGLYALGHAGSFYAPPGYDPDADLTKWFALTNAGDLADNDHNPLTIDVLEELREHHSSYYIQPSTAPAPLLISNGWTDDLFPPDEAIRFYNRTRALFPDSPISLFFLDYGHQRGQGKSKDTAQLKAAQDAWFAHYLKGEGPAPLNGVTALTQTCGPDHGDGPYRADSFLHLASGEVRFTDPTVRSVANGGNPAEGQAFDPISGPGACATADASDDPTDSATVAYDVPVTGAGFTMLGSPTIKAGLTAPLANQQLAARLVDVGPDGKATLVARGLYRPEVSTVAVDQVWQLHPNGWRFAPGHVARLELLTSDAPYGRPSNVELAISVQNFELRLPTLDAPDGGLVKAPAPKIVPVGAQLAR